MTEEREEGPMAKVAEHINGSTTQQVREVHQSRCQATPSHLSVPPRRPRESSTPPSSPSLGFHLPQWLPGPLPDSAGSG